MKRQGLIDLYHQVDEIAAQRKALGEFDANAKTIIDLLDAVLALIEHEIEILPVPASKRKK